MKRCKQKPIKTIWAQHIDAEKKTFTPLTIRGGDVKSKWKYFSCCKCTSKVSYFTCSVFVQKCVIKLYRTTYFTRPYERTAEAFGVKNNSEGKTVEAVRWTKINSNRHSSARWSYHQQHFSYSIRCNHPNSKLVLQVRTLESNPYR